MRTCRFCSAEFRIQGKGTAYGFICKAKPCRREYQRLRMRDYVAGKKAEGIDVYAPYRQAQYARIRARLDSGELAPARQRYPERMRAIDQRRRAQKAGVGSEEFTHLEIFERDGWICGICTLPVDPSEVWPEPGFGTLGHVIPFARGGLHARANVRLEHLYCNVVKSDKLDSEMGLVP